MSKVEQPKAALIRGAAWHVAMRWAIRGIGLISTAVMARLLMPADYGVIGMSMLVVGIIQTFLDFSVGTALLRKGEVSRDEVDSAWSLGVIQGALVSLLMLVMAPFAALYFQEPRVQPVLWVFAACVGLASAGNIGFVLAQKEFDFSLAFRLGVFGKVLGAVATITAGYYLRDYRALVIGVATGYISGLVLSYWMHPYRPRWNVSRIGEIWALTRWLMLSGVGGFVLRKGDEIIAARIGTAAEYGQYNVGADLGLMPAGEVGPGLLRAFLPVLSSIQNDVRRTNLAVLKAMSAVNTVTMPLGLGFAAVALPATTLVLGPAWSGTAPYVAAFALVGTVQTLISPLNTLLILRGHTRVQSFQVWCELVVFVVAALLLVPAHFLFGLVWARIIGSSAAFGLSVLSCHKYCDLPYLMSLRAIGRPLLGATLMYFLASAVVSFALLPIVGLVIAITVSVIFYVTWSVVTWALVGRPEGLESTVLDYFKNRK